MGNYYARFGGGRMEKGSQGYLASRLPCGKDQPFDITSVTNDQNIYFQPKGNLYFYYVIYENDFTAHFTDATLFHSQNILSMMCKDDCSV